MASATLEQNSGRLATAGFDRQSNFHSNGRFVDLRSAWTYGRFGHLRASSRISKSFQTGLAISPRR